MDRENQPMSEAAKKALRECLPKLCVNMETTQLMDWMRSKNALTNSDVQNIEVIF